MVYCIDIAFVRLTVVIGRLLVIAAFVIYYGFSHEMMKIWHCCVLKQKREKNYCIVTNILDDKSPLFMPCSTFIFLLIILT